MLWARTWLSGYAYMGTQTERNLNSSWGLLALSDRYIMTVINGTGTGYGQSKKMLVNRGISTLMIQGVRPPEQMTMI